jgi:hypothetical protein
LPTRSPPGPRRGWAGCLRSRRAHSASAVVPKSFAVSHSAVSHSALRLSAARPVSARSRRGVTFPLLCHACLSFSP